jgi:hypothetical protein
MKKWTFIIAAFLLLSAQWLYSQTSISAVSTFSRTEDFINSSGLHRYNVIVQLDAANSTGFDIYYTFSTPTSQRPPGTTMKGTATPRCAFRLEQPSAMRWSKSIPIPISNG